MSPVPTTASVAFRPDGVPHIEANLRLDDMTSIYCFTYDDHAPSVVIVSANVRVSLAAPDLDHVTSADVERGRELAEAVTRYVAELEHRAAAGKDAASEGQAA
jgi:hypothetical protein